MRGFAIVALVALAPATAAAHGGGLDSRGCHHDAASYHCHGGSGNVDPMIFYGIGYGSMGLGAVFTLIGYGAAGDVNDMFTYSLLLYGASELSAIVGVMLRGEIVHFGVLTALNVVGAAFSIGGLVAFAPRPPPAARDPNPYRLTIGPGWLAISGTF